MRITPLDIIQKQFTSSRRGYDGDEVSAFLDEVRESMEELLNENQRLREMVTRREAEVAELREGESDLKETLILARRLSDELQRGARREADVVVGEARLEAERIMSAAADERRELEAENLLLRTRRARLLGEMRGIVDAHVRLLDELDASPPSAR